MRSLTAWAPPAPIEQSIGSRRTKHGHDVLERRAALSGPVRVSRCRGRASRVAPPRSCGIGFTLRDARSASCSPPDNRSWMVHPRSTWRGGRSPNSAIRAQRGRPDALLAWGEDPVRVDGVLDRLDEPAVRVPAEAVLLGGEVHEVEMSTVLPVPELARVPDEQLRGVVGAHALRLVLGVEDDQGDIAEAPRVRRNENSGIVQPCLLLDQTSDQITHRKGVRSGETGD